MSVVTSSSDCASCGSLFPKGGFNSREELNPCMEAVEEAVANGVLTRIKKPEHVQRGHPLAVSAFYSCKCCGSVWELASPEREFIGAWRKVR